jgi:DNA uptake protein ComE-like DNA-binding protein
MVGFEFLSRGILVGGRWYPILKMEWIDGEPINEYIGHNLTQRHVLQSLARQWIDLIGSLRRAQIAHCDLQHENIIVSNGVLRLIDYDAMYVPALLGLGSHEEGHRNYQHPGRTGRDYHPGLDNFSSWVIFTSISALAIDPHFWKVLNGGDGCLLFRREDFEKPRTSKALQMLETHGNLQLQVLVSHFRSILCLPISQVPSLDGSILDQQTKPDQSRSQSNRGHTQELPGWLGDHINQPKDQTGLEPLEAGTTESRIGDAAWLYDYLIDDGPSAQSHPVIIQRRDRIALWSFLGILTSMAAAWAASWVSGSVLGVVMLLALATCSLIIIMGYRAANPTGKRKGIQERHSAKCTALNQLESVINLSKLERARLGEPPSMIKKSYDKLPQLTDAEAEQLDRNLAGTLAGIEARRRKAKEDHDVALRIMDAEAEQLDRDLARTLESIEAHRRKVKQDEEEEVRQYEQQMKVTVSNLVQRRSLLDSEEKSEVNRILQEARSLHIGVALSKAALSASVVSGVGEALAERLYAAGVSCALDVTSYNRVRKVPGIGDAKANALVAWRQGVEQRANRSAPSLSQAESSRIRGKYATLRQRIDQQIASSKDEERRERQQILQRYAAPRGALDAEEHSARRDFNIQRDTVQAKNVKEREKLAAEGMSIEKGLNAEEESAKRHHTLQREAVKERFTKGRERLAAEYKVEKMKAVEAQKQLDKKLDQLNRALFQMRLEVRQTERELDRIKVISPTTYLRLFLQQSGLLD